MVLAVLFRLILFAVVGLAGWMIGGLVGGFIGAGLDLLANQPSGSDAAISFAWAAGMIGGLVGVVGSIMWLAIHMRRNAR